MKYVSLKNNEKQIAFKLHGVDVVFEVLTAVVMNCSIFWDITSCGLLIVN
jgi:hypothetical protein